MDHFLAAGKGASNGASEYLKVPTMIGRDEWRILPVPLTRSRSPSKMPTYRHWKSGDLISTSELECSPAAQTSSKAHYQPKVLDGQQPALDLSLSGRGDTKDGHQPKLLVRSLLRCLECLSSSSVRVAQRQPPCGGSVSWWWKHTKGSDRLVVGVFLYIGDDILPSRELTYPSKMAFWRWFSFSQGGICDRSLEGIQII